jgi:hypothetical protein
MIEKNDNNDGIISIQDNFLAEEKFTALRDFVSTDDFPWYFSSKLIYDPRETPSTSPGQFVHIVYQANVPTSQFYDSHLHPILKALNVAVLGRIKLNLQLRLPEPFYSLFHIDMPNVALHFTTSILYINTNNGYTELESGEKIESVANRLVSFPTNIKHRGVSQTDEQTRVLLNFNYLKREV